MLDYQKDFISYALDCGVLKIRRVPVKVRSHQSLFLQYRLVQYGAQLGKLGHFYAQALIQSGINRYLYGPAYKGNSTGQRGHL